MDDPSNISWWLKNLGLPGVVVFCQGMFLWSAWAFLKPYLHLWFTKHFALIDQISAKLSALPQKEHLDTISTDVKYIRTKIKSDGDMLAVIHRHVTHNKKFDPTETEPLGEQ